MCPHYDIRKSESQKNLGSYEWIYIWLSETNVVVDAIAHPSHGVLERSRNVQVVVQDDESMLRLGADGTAGSWPSLPSII